MGIINDYKRFIKGSDVKNIFLYADGKATVNRVIVHDITQFNSRLIADGWRLA